MLRGSLTWHRQFDCRVCVSTLSTCHVHVVCLDLEEAIQGIRPIAVRRPDGKYYTKVRSAGGDARLADIQLSDEEAAAGIRGEAEQEQAGMSSTAHGEAEQAPASGSTGARRTPRQCTTVRSYSQTAARSLANDGIIAVRPYSLNQATPGLIGAQFWKAQGMTSNPMCFAVLVAFQFPLAIIHIHTMLITMVCVLTPVLTPLLLF